MIEESQGWCCELYGGMIKGLCNNRNGYVTHIGNCSEQDEDKTTIQDMIKIQIKESEEETRAFNLEESSFNLSNVLARQKIRKTEKKKEMGQ